MSEVVRRATELKFVPATDEVTPLPASGRTFMDFPQKVRFNIYECVLSSDDPIVRPWPKTKFTMQLLRISKDIFAETAYCFYGKVRRIQTAAGLYKDPADHIISQGDLGYELEQEIDLLSTHDQNRAVYMSGIPPCHVNRFQMSMNHATGKFGTSALPTRF